MSKRDPGLTVRRADVPKPPKWWQSDWTEIIFVDANEFYTRTVVVDQRPFEGGGLADRDELVIDSRLARKMTGFFRHRCQLRIPPSVPPVSP